MQIESTDEMRLQKPSRFVREAGSKDSDVSSAVEEMEERDVASEKSETGLIMSEGDSTS